MTYNLDPLINISKNSTSGDIWKDRIYDFFHNDNYDPVLLDEYYHVLISDVRGVSELLNGGFLIDDYSGLFTFNTPLIQSRHTFNMANFIRRNSSFFHDKKIKTMTADYGIFNIQLKLCGLDLKTSILSTSNWVGMALAVIGNQCAPYRFNEDTEDFDVIFAANVFDTLDLAYTNWSYLYEKNKESKDVFITSHSFHELKHIITYDKIQQMENPSEIYDEETYTNIDLGYSSKIYRIV